MQQLIDERNAKAKAEADKAAETKKIAARRAAYKTVARLEPNAVINDGSWEDEEGAINFAVKMVRLNGYRCDSVNALFHLSWGRPGAVLKCNYRYTYDIEDKGGHWVVTVE
jgi:hypothetical protein